MSWVYLPMMSRGTICGERECGHQVHTNDADQRNDKGYKMKQQVELFPFFNPGNGAKIEIEEGANCIADRNLRIQEDGKVLQESHGKGPGIKKEIAAGKIAAGEKIVKSQFLSEIKLEKGEEEKEDERGKRNMLEYF